VCAVAKLQLFDAGKAPRDEAKPGNKFQPPDETPQLSPELFDAGKLPRDDSCTPCDKFQPPDETPRLPLVLVPLQKVVFVTPKGVPVLPTANVGVLSTPEAGSHRALGLPNPVAPTFALAVDTPEANQLQVGDPNDPTLEVVAVPAT
jgi:hypothetical protein